MDASGKIRQPAAVNWIGTLATRGSVLAGMLAMAACGGSSAPPGSSMATTGHAITGRVMGGQQAVANSQITIFLAGSGGYGANGSQLVSTTTGADGTFSFDPSSFTCPNPDVPVYAVASQGAPGGVGSNNPSLKLSAALGTCGALATTFLNINEVTTVASVWALSQFLDSTGAALGAPSTNLTGLANAAATVANLADVSAGQAATAMVSGATGNPPAAAVNTLANILSHCVNSDGDTAAGSVCQLLFSAATLPGAASAPADTLQAALSIARNPGNNVATLFGLTSAGDPFQAPQPLAAAPSDWTLAIQLTDTAFNPVNAMAIDAAGNVWITAVSGQLQAIQSNGVPLPGSPFSGGGLASFIPLALTIDLNGNIWVGTNVALGQALAVFNSAGQPISGSPFTAPALESGVGPMVADSLGNLWVINAAGRGTVTEFSPSGGSFTSTNQTLAASEVFAPTGIAFDTAGDLWTSYGGEAAAAQAAAGAAVPGSPYTLTTSANGVILPATDGSVWVLESQNPGLTHLTPDTTTGGFSPNFVSISPVMSTFPSEGAIDGAGNIWLVSGPDSSGDTSLYELNSSGVPVAQSGFQNGQLRTSLGMAIDSSGNIWIGGTQYPNAGVAGGVGLVEVVGAAAPVKTPVIGAAQLP